MSPAQTRESIADFDRCDTFWARRETDRPLLSCSLASQNTLVSNYPHGTKTIPEGWVRPGDIDIRAFQEDYESLFTKQQACGVDVPWAAYPLISVPWCEAILNCAIYHSGGNMAAKPWVTDYRQIEDLEVEPDNPWLLKLLEFQEFLVRLSRGRFPVSKALMRGPLDLLSAVRGSQNMCLDLYDRPAEVHAALSRLTDLWMRLARAQAQVLPPFEGGYSFGVIDLWAREEGGWFQDDAVALWSPGAYREHVRPCEERLSGCMGFTGIHVHPQSIFALGDLVQMSELGVIEVNYEKPYGMTLDEMIPHLRRALEVKCLVIWGDFDPAELQLLAAKLPSRGLALDIIGETPEKVRSVVNAVKHIWGHRGN